jgi:hypothetical protein
MNAPLTFPSPPAYRQAGAGERARGGRLRLTSLLFIQTGIVSEEIRVMLGDILLKNLYLNRIRRAIKRVLFVRIKPQVKGPALILLQ